MATLTIGGKTVITQTGTDEPIITSNVVMDNVNLANVNLANVNMDNVNMDNVNINNALASATFPAGHVVQIQTATNNDSFMVSSESYLGTSSTISGLTLEFNKLLSNSFLFFSISLIGLIGSESGQSGGGYARIIKGTSSPYTEVKDFGMVQKGANNSGQGTTFIGASVFLQYKYVSSHTGTETYTIEIHRAVNSWGYRLNYLYPGSGESTMTIYEIMS